MDSQQLVYAIEICMLLNPRDFLPSAIRFLAHRDFAVCCAACRAIERLPQSALTDHDLNEIRAIPIISLVDKHYRTGVETHVGTNEEFLRSILAKYAR